MIQQSKFRLYSSDGQSVPLKPGRSRIVTGCRHHIGGNMIYPEPTVHVQTEACYREYRRGIAALFPFCPVGPEVEEITADRLVDVLNSAAERGTTRHYVVLEEK